MRYRLRIIAYSGKDFLSFCHIFYTIYSIEMQAVSSLLDLLSARPYVDAISLDGYLPKPVRHPGIQQAAFDASGDTSLMCGVLLNTGMLFRVSNVSQATPCGSVTQYLLDLA